MGLETGSDVALAFGLVLAAGFSTTVGSSFAFCAKISDSRSLAIALAASAGVMIYVSFAEIFLDKAVSEFEAHGYNGDVALCYATLCFFGGLIFTALLNACTRFLLGKKKPSTQPTQEDVVNKSVLTGGIVKDCRQDVEMGSSRCENPGCQKEVAGLGCLEECRVKNPQEKNTLEHAGLISAVAICLHNLPEGLATFVSTLADSTTGIAIAVAIVLHNIPEGVAVAMPIYYATGSRVRAFLWAFLSGVSEPIGAILGWIILSSLGPLAYAIMFGVVAGMMVFISMRELLPTAFRLDPEDAVVTTSLFIGMAVMAASLVLFKFA